MPSHSTNQSEPNIPVPESASALRTWLFDTETSDDNDSHISFLNRPSTTTTTSTKPDSVSEYLIDTDSEPGAVVLLLAVSLIPEAREKLKGQMKKQLLTRNPILQTLHVLQRQFQT